MGVSRFTMIAATLFSGIGSAELAMPGWRWPWHAEIEKFPAAVMAARHPRSVNLGDVTAHDFLERARCAGAPDVLVFGSPCQDFSVAGRRLGLDGPRGNLALVALAIVGKLRPRWFVFENVPGLLSNWSGAEECPPGPGSGIDTVENSDFAAFLGTVDEIRYHVAWAGLDAQYFGLAQRRERLFAVGHSGDWRGPAAVLLEPEGLCGNPPPREQPRQATTGAIGAGSPRSGGRAGASEAAANQIVAGTLTGAMGRRNGAPGEGNPEDHVVAGTLSAAAGKSRGAGMPPEMAVASLDASFARHQGASHQNGNHGHSHLVPVAFGGNNTSGSIEVATAVRAKGGTGHGDFESETFVATAFKASHYTRGRDGAPSDVAPPLSADADKGDQDTLIAFDLAQVTSRENRSDPQPGDPCHVLAAEGKPPAIAFTSKDHGQDAGEELSPTLRAMPGAHHNAGGQVAVAFDCKAGGDTSFSVGEKAGALRGDGHGGGHAAIAYGIGSDAVDRSGEGAAGTAAERSGLNIVENCQPTIRPRPNNSVGTATAVRRLTPRECEKLQGFPPGYTSIPVRRVSGANQQKARAAMLAGDAGFVELDGVMWTMAADGPRYRSLGNAMAVPVMRWILERLEQVDAIMREAKESKP